jgi:hypothetical protein
MRHCERRDVTFLCPTDLAVYFRGAEKVAVYGKHRTDFAVLLSGRLVL